MPYSYGGRQKRVRRGNYENERRPINSGGGGGFGTGSGSYGSTSSSKPVKKTSQYKKEYDSKKSFIGVSEEEYMRSAMEGDLNSGQYKIIEDRPGKHPEEITKENVKLSYPNAQDKAQKDAIRKATLDKAEESRNREKLQKQQEIQSGVNRINESNSNKGGNKYAQDRIKDNKKSGANKTPENANEDKGKEKKPNLPFWASETVPTESKQAATNAKTSAAASSKAKAQAHHNLEIDSDGNQRKPLKGGTKTSYGTSDNGSTSNNKKNKHKTSSLALDSSHAQAGVGAAGVAAAAVGAYAAYSDLKEDQDLEKEKAKGNFRVTTGIPNRIANSKGDIVVNEDKRRFLEADSIPEEVKEEIHDIGSGNDSGIMMNNNSTKTSTTTTMETSSLIPTTPSNPNVNAFDLHGNHKADKKDIDKKMEQNSNIVTPMRHTIISPAQEFSLNYVKAQRAIKTRYAPYATGVVTVQHTLRGPVIQCGNVKQLH